MIFATSMFFKQRWNDFCKNLIIYNLMSNRFANKGISNLVSSLINFESLVGKSNALIKISNQAKNLFFRR